MKIKNVRLEVMKTMEQSMDEILDKYLKPIEKNWQPADLLPDSSDPNFFEEVQEIQALCMDMEYDLFTVLIGDTITEEALPSYESWLMDVDGIDNVGRNGWSQWIRSWTAEENRHGDLLNTYLYLSGRVDMKEMQTTTQYLISDGFDIGTDRDPYRNFIYTSFQELATNISHRRVASGAKKMGNKRLAKICGVIAADELRHANAYISFVKEIINLDPSELMLALEDMMRKKIIMPAHMMRSPGQEKGELWDYFSDSAQRCEVYTTMDYIDIFRSVLDQWDIGNVTGLTDEADKARTYVMNLPDRLTKIASRTKIPEQQYPFRWVKK